MSVRIKEPLITVMLCQVFCSGQQNVSAVFFSPQMFHKVFHVVAGVLQVMFSNIIVGL
jgi:hypothetical protein